MNIDLVSKALANPLRRQILLWLRTPNAYFQTQECDQNFHYGVCAGQIERMGQVAQSTMSNHLSILQNAQLIQAKKHGQWSYFSRNEVVIQQYIQHLQATL